MKKLERDEVTKLRKRVKLELGINSVKLDPTNYRGLPDIMFLMPERPAFIEFKRKNEKPTKLQLHRIVQLQELGYNCMWTDDYAKAFQWLAYLVAARIPSARNDLDGQSSVRGHAPRSRAGKK